MATIFCFSDRVLDMVCRNGIILEIVKAVIEMNDRFYSALYLCFSTLKGVDEVGLEGEAMCY